MISISSQWVGEATVDTVSVQIPISATWTSDDPLVLSCSLDGVKWVIGRDLIRQGLSSRSPLGGGDIRVSCSTTSLFLELDGKGGDSLVWMPKERMQGFLNKTYSLAPEGEEQMDMDSVIERILSS